jgi:hypothetical protein
MVGILGSLFSMLSISRAFDDLGNDPAVFVGFGEESVAINRYAEDRLGREVPKRPHMGHDGKYFFVQAHDPLLLDVEGNVGVIDRPVYRSQRMFYPLIAGAGGSLGSAAIVWGLLLVNVFAMGAGTFATARVAQQMGGSPWWGLAFALNIGIVSEVNIDGAGVVAAAFAFGAVAALLARRNGWALAFLVMSALSREVMVVVALGVALWLWRERQRRWAAISAVVPVLVVAGWALYVRGRLGGADTSVGFAFEWPFVGLAKAIPAWAGSSLDLAAGIAVVVLLVAFVIRTMRSGALVGWAFVGFVPLTLVLSELVWTYYYDLTRAVAPLITAFVLMVFVAGRNASASDIPAADRTLADA